MYVNNCCSVLKDSEIILVTYKTEIDFTISYSTLKNGSKTYTIHLNLPHKKVQKLEWPCFLGNKSISFKEMSKPADLTLWREVDIS